MSSQALISIDDLRSLRSNLERLWRILISVATGGEYVRDVEQDYAELRREIDRLVAKLNASGARFNIELFLTLSEWHVYSRKHLKSYASRRAFIADKLSGPIHVLERVVQEFDNTALTPLQIVSLLNQHLGNSRAQLDFADLHPKIIQRCKIHFDNAQYDDALLSAMKLVETELRAASGLAADDVGVHLASKALGKDGVLALPAAKTVSEQEAVHQLFRGALGFFKNPLSHRFIDESDRNYTFMILGFASVLLILIDQLKPQLKP